MLDIYVRIAVRQNWIPLGDVRASRRRCWDHLLTEYILDVPKMLYLRWHIHLPLYLRCPKGVVLAVTHSLTSPSSVPQSCCTCGDTFTYLSVFCVPKVLHLRWHIYLPLCLRYPKGVSLCATCGDTFTYISVFGVPNLLHLRWHIHLPLCLRCPKGVALAMTHSLTSLSSVSQRCCTCDDTFTYLSVFGVPKELHLRWHIHFHQTGQKLHCDPV